MRALTSAAAHGSRLSADGPPPGGGPLRGRAHVRPTSTRLPRPSTRSTPASSRRWWRRRRGGARTGRLRGTGVAVGGRAQRRPAARRRRVEVTVLPALSFLDLAWAALGIDPLAEGVRLVDARDFGRRGRERGRPVPGGPVLVAPPALRGEAGCPRRRRPGAAAAGAPAPPRPRRRGGGGGRLVGSRPHRGAGPPHLRCTSRPRLRRRPSSGDDMARLVALMDTLRARCPWGPGQTHTSLMPHLVEECYEVLDALSALDGTGDERLRAPAGGAR